MSPTIKLFIFSFTGNQLGSILLTWLVVQGGRLSAEVEAHYGMISDTMFISTSNEREQASESHNQFFRIIFTSVNHPPHKAY